MTHRRNEDPYGMIKAMIDNTLNKKMRIKIMKKRRKASRLLKIVEESMEQRFIDLVKKAEIEKSDNPV